MSNVQDIRSIHSEHRWQVDQLVNVCDVDPFRNQELDLRSTSLSAVLESKFGNKAIWLWACGITRALSSGVEMALYTFCHDRPTRGARHQRTAP